MKIKYCPRCSNTKRKYKCEFCGLVKIRKEDLRMDWPEVVPVENVMKGEG